MSNVDPLQKALEQKLNRFSQAANKHGIKAVVHARPTRSDWRNNSLSFAAKMAAGLAILAGAYVAQATLHTAPQPQSGSAVVSGKVVQAPTPEQAPEPSDWRSAKFERIRQDLRYVDLSVAKKHHQVLDAASRLSLVKAVASELRLHEHGVDWKDLYAIIHAETGWIARDGMGANKVVSSGLAQLEPATAKSIGITDAKDPIQAVWAAGHLLSEAADWSQSRVSMAVKHKTHLTKTEMHSAFKSGISIYYNTSTGLRNTWNVKNTNDFPDATQVHIKNSKDGALMATVLEKQIGSVSGHLTGIAPQDDSQVAAMVKQDDSQVVNILNMVEPNARVASTERAARTLQDGLDHSCEITSVMGPKMALRIHSTCKVVEDATVNAGEGNSIALGNVYMTGRYKDVPVYLSSGGSRHFGAMATSSNESASIVLHQSFIEKLDASDLNSEEKQDVIRFVIGHEYGHIANHDDGEHSSTAHEIEADAASLQELINEGKSAADALKIASNTMEVLSSYVSLYAAPDQRGLINSNLQYRFQAIKAELNPPENRHRLEMASN